MRQAWDPPGDFEATRQRSPSANQDSTRSKQSVGTIRRRHVASRVSAQSEDDTWQPINTQTSPIKGTHEEERKDGQFRQALSHSKDRSPFSLKFCKILSSISNSVIKDCNIKINKSKY